jgi:hypothetical protein
MLNIVRQYNYKSGTNKTLATIYFFKLSTMLCILFASVTVNKDVFAFDCFLRKANFVYQTFMYYTGETDIFCRIYIQYRFSVFF